MNIIKTQHDLEVVCAHLATGEAIAIDTEFTRTQTYWPILSLVQVSDGKNGYIIDFYGQTLNPAPLIELLSNPKIVKIVHSCRQDFEIFLKSFGVLPVTIFDTQVAALLLYPHEEMGLSKLLHELFGFELNKTQQNTDWLQRPLTQKQLEYALSDVEHLHDLRQVLQQKLEEKGRLGWFYEEQQFLLDVQTYAVDMDTIWKKAKSRKVNVRSLSPLSFLLLHRLSQWREQKAQLLNYNRGRVLSDDTLLQIIQNPPKTSEEMQEQWKGLLQIKSTQPHYASLLEELWDEIENGRRVPRESWPSLKKKKMLNGAENLLLEKLRVLQISIAEELNISPRVLATNDDMKNFCLGNQQVSFMKGWRYDVFGIKAMALKV